MYVTKPFTATVIARAIRAYRLQTISAAEQARREALKALDKAIDRSNLK